MKRKERRPDRFTTLFAVIDALVMYLFVVAGVFISRYVEDYRAGRPIDFGKVDPARMIMTLLLAFGQLTMFEQVGKQDRVGRRKVKAFVRRAAAALSSGIAYHFVIGG